MDEKIRRIVPNINSGKVEESCRFYSDLLGLEVAMDLGWVVTLISPHNKTAQITLVRTEKITESPPGFSITIEVGDVDAIYNKAVALGITVTYPLTSESYGVRHFLVTDPNGVALNIMSHIR